MRIGYEDGISDCIRSLRRCVVPSITSTEKYVLERVAGVKLFILKVLGMYRYLMTSIHKMFKGSNVLSDNSANVMPEEIQL